MPKSEPKKKAPGPKIRPMEVDDLAQVFHLGEKLFTADTFPNLYRTWDEFEVVGLYQSDSEYCFVAEINDHIIGFVLGTVISKTKSAWKYGHLIWMGVDPAFSRQGIAERLAKIFLQTTLEEGVRMLIVDTEADNLPAVKFFRKMGFGNPQEHIYLSMNLSGRQSGSLEKKETARRRSRAMDTFPKNPIQPQRLLHLLHRMIDIYSPSGKEEELLAYLSSFFKKRQLPVRRQMLEDGRFNLIVAPPDVEIELALIGHLDTVVAHDLEDRGFSQENDSISGLGAADMKGGCAALIESFLCHWESGGKNRPVALILVVGEEENGDGAIRLLEDYHFPWAIIAEPTRLNPCLAHYGYIEMQLITQGKRRHASLAKGRSNPVERMLKTLLALTHHMDARRPEAVYNIRDLRTSQSGFAVPEWCHAWLDLHLPPHTPTGALCAELEEVVAACLHGKARLPTEVRFHTIQDGYDLPSKGTVVEALRKVYAARALPWQPEAFPSHSDANLLWAHGIKPILLGPGSLANAHVPDESVSTNEVIDAAGIYYQLLMTMFSPSL